MFECLSQGYWCCMFRARFECPRQKPVCTNIEVSLPKHVYAAVSQFKSSAPTLFLAELRLI